MRKNLDSGVLHAMRAFVCVVDAGSFSQAAEQVQLTTAQVSRLVSDLEKRLQAKLLQRNTRRQTLTEAGTAYLASCRQILDLVALAEAQAGGAALAASGRLRVQCMTNFGQHYVSPLLPEFFERHPAVQVEYNTSQYAPDLLARGTDVSLYLAAQLPDSALVSRRLGTTFSVLCASPAYLAGTASRRRRRTLPVMRVCSWLTPRLAWRGSSLDKDSKLTSWRLRARASPIARTWCAKSPRRVRVSRCCRCLP